MPEREHLLKAEILEVSASSGDSSQPNEHQAGFFGTPKDAIPPPLPPESLRQLSTINQVRRDCILAIARNTVGLGWSLGVREGEEQTGQDLKEQIKKATERLDSICRRDVIQKHPNLTGQLFAAKWDEEEVGTGYVEVSRDQRTGQIDGLFHLPAFRIRRRSDRNGYYLLPPDGDTNSGTPYYEFGEKVTYTRQGAPTNQLQKGRHWKVNEIISFGLYTSESRDYGLPRDSAMALEYLGDKLAIESNVSFFDSSGTPPSLIFVQGSENEQNGRVTFTVPRETTERVATTLKSDGGHRKRVALIPVPPGTQTQHIQLGQISDRDVGFTSYRGDNARRALAAFQLQPIFVPVLEDSGRYTAEVQRAITLEQVFDPEQTRYEDKITAYVLNDLGFPKLQFTLKRLAVEADAAKRDSADKMTETGDITRREHRKAHGYGPLPEAKQSETEIEWEGETFKSEEPEPGQVPFGWNDKIIDTGKPRGAENRESFGNDNRGLDAGIGGREQRSTPEELAAQAAKNNGKAVAAVGRAVASG